MEGEVCDKRHFPRKENEEQTFAAFIDKYIELELPKKPKSYKKQRMQLLWWKQQLDDYFLVYVTNSMISELGLERDGISDNLCDHLRYNCILHSYFPCI